MIKKLLFSLVSCVLAQWAFNQESVSIHQQQSREYSKMLSVTDEKQWDVINQYRPEKLFKSQISECKLKKVVFGWHPYWNGTTYTEYDFSLLSDIAYFSYEVDPATGSYSTIHSWKTTSLIDLAKNAGTRVSLTVTLFSGHRTFLENLKSRQTLIDSLISLVSLRGAQGVNIDFEAVPSSQRDNLTQFMKELGTRFHTQLPGSVISIAIPAVDWGNSFDVRNMLPYVDLFIIMGYDFYYSGSSKAGPVSPKNDGKFWLPYDATRSVRYYLQTGIPNEKLCLGVPYYGYDWPTTDSTVNSNTIGSGTARLYKDAVASALSFGRLWDRHASVPYYSYQNGSSWRQCWYDDATSLGFKYDMVNTYNIGGIGIWALGYDRSTQELWTLLREKFSTCGNTLCSGSFTDMGGPEGDYFPSDNYTFTISQKDSGNLSAIFTDFQIDTTDTLIVYAGPGVRSPVIGRYTGLTSPKVVNNQKGSLTFRFVSSKTSAAKGWQSNWNCGASLPAEALKLTQSSISENQPKGKFIGRMIFPDSIIMNKGSIAFTGNDNSDQLYFRLAGDSILTNATFNYEKRSSYLLTVEGEDNKLRRVLNNLPIEVTDANDPPVALNNISDQTLRLGESFTVQLPTAAFADEDAHDSLSIVLSESGADQLPVWMNYNHQTFQLTGIATGRAGTLDMVLKAIDRAGATASIPFKIIVEKPLGYVDSMSAKVLVYPNPTSGILWVLVSKDFRLWPYVYIYDFKGSEIGQFRLTLDDLDRQKAVIDLGSFSNGLYFLKLQAGGKIYVEKVLVLK